MRLVTSPPRPAAVLCAPLLDILRLRLTRDFLNQWEGLGRVCREKRDTEPLTLVRAWLGPIADGVERVLQTYPELRPVGAAFAWTAC